MDKAIHTDRYKAFCAHLRDLRIEAGLDQTDVAARLGVAQSVVSSFEGGHRRLDIAELDQIATVLGVALVDLVRDY